MLNVFFFFKVAFSRLKKKEFFFIYFHFFFYHVGPASLLSCTACRKIISKRILVCRDGELYSSAAPRRPPHLMRAPLSRRDLYERRKILFIHARNDKTTMPRRLKRVSGGDFHRAALRAQTHKITEILRDILPPRVRCAAVRALARRQYDYSPCSFQQQQNVF